MSALQPDGSPFPPVKTSSWSFKNSIGTSKVFNNLARKSFSLGQIVYLKHHEGKHPGVVNGILEEAVGYEYRVSWPHLDGTWKWHHEVELTSEYEPNFG
jgi:hypothetical protein